MVSINYDSESTRDAICLSIADSAASIEVIAHDTVVVPGSITERTELDCVYEDHMSATVNRGWQIYVDRPAKFQSLDPSIATVDEATGVVSWQSNGTARIKVKTAHCIQEMRLAVFQDLSGTASEWKEFTEGALARHVMDTFDSLVSASEEAPAIRRPQFIEYPVAELSRNPDCWLPPAFSKCAEAIVNGYWGWSGAMPVTPRHCISADHLHPSVGTTLTWVTEDDQIVNRIVVSYVRIGDIGSDVAMLTLDSDLPESIGFAKVLPSNWSDFLPSIPHVATESVTTRPIPCVWTNHTRSAIITQIERAYSGVIGTHASYSSAPIYTQFSDFYRTAIAGNSGSSLWTIINNQIVFVYALSSAVSGPDFSQYVDLANEAITLSGSSHQISVVDLSGFTNYGE